MTRAERRRAQRKRALLHELNEQRRLPADIPNPEGDLVTTTRSEGQEAINAVKRSGVTPYMNRKTRDHSPGVSSKITPLVLATASILAAKKCNSARITDICSVIAGFDSAIAIQLGIYTLEGRVDIGYKNTAKQIKKTLTLLADDGWEDDDGTVCDLDWYEDSFLGASLPDDIADMGSAVAVDSTAVLAWAKGKKGPKGKKPVSADPHADFGYRTGTSTTEPGSYFGYSLHLSTICKRPIWTGDLAKAGFVDPVLPFIVGMRMVPANSNDGPAGYDVVQAAKRRMTRLKAVIADRGYTDKKAFTTPLHKEKIQVIMDMHPYAKKTTKALDLGRGKSQRLIEHTGSFFPEQTPDKFLNVPKGLSEKKLREWYADRHKYAWVVVERFLEDGGVKIRCPQCDGRIDSKAKTPKPQRNRAKAGGRKSKKTVSGPARSKKANKAKKRAVYVEADIEPGQYCCRGHRVNVPVEDRKRTMDFPFGTPAWHSAYSVRNQAENSNKGIKDRFGLQKGWCRSMNLPANRLGALYLVVAQNLKYCRRLARIQAGPATLPDNTTGESDDAPTGDATGTATDAPANDPGGTSP